MLDVTVEVIFGGRVGRGFWRADALGRRRGTLGIFTLNGLINDFCVFCINIMLPFKIY